MTLSYGDMQILIRILTLRRCSVQSKLIEEEQEEEMREMNEEEDKARGKVVSYYGLSILRAGAMFLAITTLEY